MASPGVKDVHWSKKLPSVADAPDSVSDKQKEDSSKKDKNDQKILGPFAHFGLSQKYRKY